MNPYNPTRWLWWTALLIAAGAAIIVYFIKQDIGYLNAQQMIGKVIMFAVIGIGICIISATAHWWIRR